MFNLEQRKTPRTPTPITPFTPSSPAQVTGAGKKRDKEKYNSKIYTLEEVDKLKQGHSILPKDKWNNMPIGGHIRYVKSVDPKKPRPLNERFKAGGYIVKYWAKNGAKGVVLSYAPPGSRGKIFYICFDKVETILLKPKVTPATPKVDKQPKQKDAEVKNKINSRLDKQAECMKLLKDEIIRLRKKLDNYEKK